MHIHEDTSKPENRVNITLFHLLMNEGIKNMITEKLGLDKNCVIFPASGLVIEDFVSSHRPDFVIQLNNDIIGYIEVELGKDLAQVKTYKDLARDDIKIYSIFGKKEYGGDLSLEEIYSFVKNKKGKIPNDSQEHYSMKLLLELIKYYVIDGNYKANNKRTSISDGMKDTPIIKALYNSIDNDKIIDEEGGKIVEGKLLINTISQSGYSVRVYSRESKNKQLSIMARSKGEPRIQFPSYKKMKNYLPNNIDFVEEYTNLLENLGAMTIKEIDKTERVSINLSDVEKNIDKMINVIKMLLS